MTLRTTCLLPLCFLAFAAPAQPAPGPATQALEARAAATGYAMSTQASFERSLMACSALPGDIGAASASAFSDWRTRNQSPLETAQAFLLVMSEMVSRAQGLEAGRQALRGWLAESEAIAASQYAEAFPAGDVTAGVCAALARALASGDADLARHPEFGPTLADMGRPPD